MATAHTRSTSYLDVWLDDAGARLRIRLTPLDHQVLQIAVADGEDESASEYLVSRVRLRRGDQSCRPRVETFTPLDLGPTRAAYEWRVACREGVSWHLESDALFDEVAGHVSLVTIRLPAERLSAARKTVEAVLSESHRSVDVGGDAAAGSALTAVVAFVREGVAHILAGWDHLAFVLVLMLGLWRLREVSLAVTGFTVGHSLTLVGTALGFTTPHGPSVEALIALSIVLVAAENVWIAQDRAGRGLPALMVALLVVATLGAAGGSAVSVIALVGLAIFTACHFGLLARAGQPHRLRVVLAALFGLLHGFGFASALAEMPLPTEHRVLALASFNLGVELGQLAVVAVLLPSLLFLARLSRSRSGVTVVASVAAAALGTFWFVGRAFG